ncbi:MAG: hypothetical protein Aurels2KO_08140 [Aureliella sp.]
MHATTLRCYKPRPWSLAYLSAPSAVTDYNPATIARQVSAGFLSKMADNRRKYGLMARKIWLLINAHHIRMWKTKHFIDDILQVISAKEPLQIRNGKAS